MTHSKSDILCWVSFLPVIFALFFTPVLILPLLFIFLFFRILNFARTSKMSWQVYAVTDLNHSQCLHTCHNHNPKGQFHSHTFVQGSGLTRLFCWLLSGDRHLCTPTITPTHSRTPALWENPLRFPKGHLNRRLKTVHAPLNTKRSCCRSCRKMRGPKIHPGVLCPIELPLTLTLSIGWNAEKKSQAPSQLSETHT